MATQRKILTRLCMALTVIALFAATVVAQQKPQPQTTTQATPGAGTVTTEKMAGEVMYVQGNNLVVRMSNGEVRTFSNIPDSRRATIDGKEVGVRDLQVGTTLQATITRTTTPVNVRTVTVGTGTVRFVAGNNVTLQLPNGEHRQYVVKPDYTFIVNGKPATVANLRPGMTVSAEKITEETRVEIAENTAVVGQAPKAAAAPAPAAPAAARAGGAGAGAPPPAAAAPAQTPPATLPRTGSPVFLMGLLGLMLLGGSSAIWMLRRS